MRRAIGLDEGSEFPQLVGTTRGRVDVPAQEQVEASVGKAQRTTHRDDVAGACPVATHHWPRAIAEGSHREDELVSRAQVTADDARADLARPLPQASDNIEKNIRVHVSRRDDRGDET